MTTHSATILITSFADKLDAAGGYVTWLNRQADLRDEQDDADAVTYRACATVLESLRAFISASPHPEPAQAAETWQGPIECENGCPPRTICDYCQRNLSTAEPESAAPAVSDEAVERFNEWFCRNFPAGVVVGDPGWWSPRVLRAALDAGFPALTAQVASLVVECEKWRERMARPAYMHLYGEHLDGPVEGCMLCEAMTLREAAEQQLAASEADAERYRWLRGLSWVAAGPFFLTSSGKMDREIDRARAATKEPT